VVKNIVHVVGARPNFVKCAPVIKGISGLMGDDVKQILIHTGQHYDKNLSDIFFNSLGMPKPDINLKIGSSKLHGAQVAEVIIGIEKFLLNKNIDLLLVYGDVNSTLGAAIAAVKLGIKIAHVEAGLRSFDTTMPEEINRMIVDRISNYHFVTENSAVKNLLNEGLDKSSIFLVGNTMIDSLYNILQTIPEQEGEKEEYVLLTLHRPSNVDNIDGLKKIIRICEKIDAKMYFPMHPRTKNNFGKFKLLEKLESIEKLELLQPVGHFEFVSLMKNSMLVITDSGGVQEETTALSIPCLTLRKNTERPSTITDGTNRLVDTSADIARYIAAMRASNYVDYLKPKLWDGFSGERIARIIKEVI